MKLLTKIREHFTRAIIPQFSPEETLLFNNFRDHPEMWSTRRMAADHIKSDHKTSGVWVLLSKSEDGEVAAFNGHQFSLQFSAAWGSIAKKRLYESEAKQRHAVTVSVLQIIAEAFDD